MEDKDQVINELKTIIFNLGEATSDFIDQAIKCNFTDAHGHSLLANIKMIQLGTALFNAAQYAEKNNFKYGDRAKSNASN